MRIALEKGKEVPPHKLAFSSKTLLRLQRNLTQFELNIKLYRQSLASQNKKNKYYNDILKKARIYLIHFIRVMNMAVVRGDLPLETRVYYGLEIIESTVPSLNTENELLSWGRRIIDGEEFRIRKCGNPINNPTIAVVKVRFENYVEAFNNHSALVKKTYDYSDKNNLLRKEVDEIILQLWNEIEATNIGLPEEQRKSLNEEYGLVYFYRKSELNSAAAS